jgi:pyruvate,orthophosphate dikinase
MTFSFGQWTLGLDGEGLPSRDLIGGKAWSVARMQSLGLSVPPAFVVTTAACKAFLVAGREPSELQAEIDAAIGWLETRTGRSFGKGPHPLLVSVRSLQPASLVGVVPIGCSPRPSSGSGSGSGSTGAPASRTT